MEDVSVVGAKLAGEQQPLRGQRFLLRLEVAGRQIELQAVGVWDRPDGTAGIAFTSQRTPRDEVVLLVGEPEAEDLWLTEGLVRKGVGALRCRTPAEAISRLVHDTPHIKAVVLSPRMSHARRQEFERFVAEEFPRVRVLARADLAVA